ncbi:DNA/RNA non-specific endonuclease [Gimesia algae]|uniref:Type VII secretion system protein EssD-like domain-containing protein n=1 Tax=Gimesia algae TaxID=2527971 RepID=A0A517VCY8_9PLAN|nr:DNA/RNA non-specific endonuclease [Gimesia algae]QDT90874.1 hypothetical protein Pan161_25280 [Gimesia algae]
MAPADTRSPLSFENEVTTETGTRHAFRENFDSNLYVLIVKAKFGGGSGLNGEFMIDTRFDGPGEGPLHMVPQGMKLNRGKGSPWAAMERQWDNALKTGDTVSVNIEINWPAAGKRPNSFTVNYTITDAKTGITSIYSEKFSNPK